MKMFEKVKGFATAKNAEAKLIRVVGEDNLYLYNYVIAVKSDGRYVPVVTHAKDSRNSIEPQAQMMAQLAHQGICVAGKF